MNFDIHVSDILSIAKTNTAKYSPELLVGLGIAAFAGTIYHTVKATMKSTVIIATAQDELEELDRISPEDNDSKKNVKIGMMTDVAVACLPAAALGIGTVACFAGSHHIQHDRVFGLAAACSTLEAGFADYRNRVIAKYGKDVDRELKYGLVNKKRKETVVDPETGKKSKVSTEVTEVDEDTAFNIYFQPEYYVRKTGKTIKNPNWQNNDLFNMTFLKAQCSWFNGKLDRGERVYLSEVYKALGIPTDDYPDTRVIGWLPKTEGGDDCYIRFNAYNTNDSFVIDDSNAVLLAFNTDGTILYK